MIDESHDQDGDLELRAASSVDPSRRRRAENPGGVMAELLALHPQLSDVEWAARDREVQRQREARAKLEPAPPATAKPSRLDELEVRGFPRRAARNVAAGMRPGRDIAALATIAADEFGVVVIGGAQGVGKTTAATWVANARAEPWRCIHAADLLAMSRFDADDRQARAELYAHPLVVDDIGAEPADAKGNFAADFDRLVDVFYAAMRPLILTTNLVKVVKKPDGTDEYPFVERYGKRAGDRLRECGRWLNIGGESLRKGSRPAVDDKRKAGA